MKGSDNYLIVRRMIEAGNRPGVIRQFLEGALLWAEANRGQDAAALRTWLALVNLDRPFYTAAELAHMWPGIKLAMAMDKAMREPPAPNRLANELKFYGLPIVRRADQIGDWFDHNGHPTEFFICEQIGRWRDVRLTPEEFQEIQNGKH